MKTIDIKSLALGAIFGTAVLALTGATLPQPSSAIGRYQVSAGAQRAYVVDTTTGQIWESVVMPNSVHPDPEFAKPKAR